MIKAKLILSFAIITFLFAINIAIGQTNFDKIKLDSLVDVLSSNNKFMGCITISKNGKVLYNKACGISSVDNNSNILSTTKTEYRIGSTSKMFTSVMIFQLIEENKLSQETKLSDFFPDIPNSKEISISNLLNHRSGIYDFTRAKDYLNWNTKSKTPSEMLKIISSGKPSFKPNKKAAYSNSNYVLLGYIIEKITNKDYSTNLKERITDKIGLKNTYYGGAITGSKNECFSYKYNNDKWVQESETDLSIPGGAGAIVSTTNDLTAFITTLFNGKLITKNSLSDMTTIKDTYGKGIFQEIFYGKTAFGHTGSIDEFRSRLYYLNNDSTSIALCSNGFEYSIYKILNGMLGIYYNKSYQIPIIKTTIVSQDTLRKYEGVYKHWILPLKMIVNLNGKNLTVIPEFAGKPQSSSTNFYAVSDNEFQSYREGVKLSFFINERKMISTESGRSMKFKRKK